MLKAWTLIGVLVPAVALAQLKELEAPGANLAIQERTYRMQHELDVAVGVLPLDPFTKGFYAEGAYTIHWTDSFAWRVLRGAYSLPARTSLREQLERDFNVLPNAFDEVQLFFGTDLLWKPFYGKLSVLNKALVHAEAYLIVGATMLAFKNRASGAFPFNPAVNVGAGFRLFASRAASFKLEITDNVLVPNPSQVLTVSLAFGLNLGATE